MPDVPSRAVEPMTKQETCERNMLGAASRRGTPIHASIAISLYNKIDALRGLVSTMNAADERLAESWADQTTEIDRLRTALDAKDAATLSALNEMARQGCDSMIDRIREGWFPSSLIPALIERRDELYPLAAASPSGAETGPSPPLLTPATPMPILPYR